MRKQHEMVKISEIMTHVTKLFDYYDEPDSFFDEFMDCVLLHDVQNALECFRDLRRHIDLFPRKEKKNASQPMQGLPDEKTIMFQMQK